MAKKIIQPEISQTELARLTAELTKNRQQIAAGFTTLSWSQMKVLMSEGLLLHKEIDKYYKQKFVRK